MGLDSAIEWTDHTWNPWRGCLKVSPGCKHCYMYRDQTRYGKDPSVVVRASPATFNAPLKWPDRAMVFTCSWSDWFIEHADGWRDDAWDIVRSTPHLTYQILTKRPGDILSRLPADWGGGFSNVWLGVSVESQDYADERIPKLAQVPAAVRFLSCEPLLDTIDVSRWLPKIDWVIGGGESGPGYREMNLDWVRSLRDQCRATGVPFFLKQLGGTRKINGAWGGNTLDGQTWQEVPAPIAAVS